MHPEYRAAVPQTRKEGAGRLIFAARCSVSLLALASAMVASFPASAQVWTGATSTDWTNAGNWSGGVPTTADVTVNTTSPNPTVLGVSGAATGTSGNMFVGSVGGPGTLTIQNGSTLTSSATAFSYIGFQGGSVGVMNVTGPGSKWTINGNPALVSLLLGRVQSGGGRATGTLNISNGGAVQTAGDIVVGETNSTGVLNVTSGGTLTTGRDAYIGRFGGSNGTATIDGSGSLWTIASRLLIGNGGPGALTISNNGVIDVATSTNVGTSGSQGTFNITSGGALQTQTLVRSTGPVQVNFDGGTLRAKTSTTSFVSGFSGTELNIAAGGLTIDTAGFDVTASSPFTGTGTFTKTGAGTLTLTGVSSYTGNSIVRAGTLVLQNGGQITGTSAMTLGDPGATTTMTVTGTGSLLQTGTITLGGVSAGTNVTLNVLSGGVVKGSSTTGIGGNVANTGTVNVDGAGSLLDVSSLLVGRNGSAANAFLNVTNGGTVRSVSGSVGYFTAATGTKSVQISGAGSSWVVTNNLDITGGASMAVLNGGAVTAATSNIGSGGTTTLLVSGAGSSYGLTGDMTLGTGVGSGTAAVTLANGGVMTVGGTFKLANLATQTGILNIGGAEGQAAAAAGTLNAATLVFGPGTGRVNFNQTDASYVFATAMSGGGSVNQTGPGTTILTADNSYTGGTTISAGTLQLGNGGTTGGIAGNVTDNGTLAFARADTYIFGGLISGSGAVNQVGSGTTILTADNSYTGPTTISSGTLQLGNGGTAGAIAGDVTDNGMLAFDRSDVFAFGGLISGSGGVNQIGSGTTILTADNSYTGRTTISSGTLQLGNGGTSGAIVGDVTDNGALVFDRSDAIGFAGVISGAGSVSQIGTGTTTLTGVNSYSGGTTITAGTLIGSATSFGSGAIADNAVLVIDQPADAAFANAIDGSGSFVKQGAGRLNYTGTGALTGPTAVAAGLLSVNGSLANSAVTVASGGTLGGNGTVGATIIQSGGIAAPGNSIGTLHINGALIQESGSIYNVELDPNTTASDLIQVNGPATIQSGAGLHAVKYVPGDYQLGTVYTVLDASGGRTGTYSLTGDTGAVSAFLGLKDTYDANHAYLTVVQLGDPIDVVQTPNQEAVAPNLPDPIVPPVLNLPDAASARNAFDQLSGAAQASARGALVSNGLYVRNVALDRLRDVVCAKADDAEAPIASTCASDRPLVWGQGFGGWGGLSGDGNAPGVNHATAGVLAGADVAVADWRVGFFGGYSHSDFHAIGLAAAGGSDDYHLGLYGGTHWDAIALRLGMSYSWDGITTDRTVAFDDFSDQLHGYDTGRTTQLFGELGYGVAWEGLNLEPFAGLSYLNLRTSAFHEGGGPAALTVQASGLEDAITMLGVRPSMNIALGGLEANLRGLVGWRHTFGDVVPTANVAFSGGNFFSVSGAPIARDAAALEAGLDFMLGDGISAGLTYGGQVSDKSTDQEARGSIRIAF